MAVEKLSSARKKSGSVSVQLSRLVSAHPSLFETTTNNGRPLVVEIPLPPTPRSCVRSSVSQGNYCSNLDRLPSYCFSIQLPHPVHITDIHIVNHGTAMLTVYTLDQNQFEHLQTIVSSGSETTKEAEADRKARMPESRSKQSAPLSFYSFHPTADPLVSVQDVLRSYTTLLSSIVLLSPLHNTSGDKEWKWSIPWIRPSAADKRVLKTSAPTFALVIECFPKTVQSDTLRSLGHIGLSSIALFGHTVS